MGQVLITKFTSKGSWLGLEFSGIPWIPRHLIGSPTHTINNCSDFTKRPNACMFRRIPAVTCAHNLDAAYLRVWANPKLRTHMIYFVLLSFLFCVTLKTFMMRPAGLKGRAFNSAHLPYFALTATSNYHHVIHSFMSCHSFIHSTALQIIMYPVITWPRL
jgi:hypothetical protein